MRLNNLSFKTTPINLVVKMESVCDKKGNVLHCVTKSNGMHENEKYFFTKFSSALDFIWTNFSD